MSEVTNIQATLEDARTMYGERNYMTAWCLLRDHMGLGTATMDEVQPWEVPSDAADLFDLLDVVDIETMLHGNGDDRDHLQDALTLYRDGDEETAYAMIDNSLSALAFIQRHDMTYCDYMDWLASISQG